MNMQHSLPVGGYACAKNFFETRITVNLAFVRVDYVHGHVFPFASFTRIESDISLLYGSTERPSARALKGT